MNGANRVVSELRNIRDWRLSTKIMIAFLVASMGAIFFLAKLTQQRSTEVLTNAQSKLLTSLAGSLAIQVDSQLLQYRRDATQVATDPETVNFFSNQAAQQANGGALLKRLTPALAADPDYRLLLLLDTDGHVVLSNEAGEQGQDFSQQEFFTRGVGAPADSPYVSDISLAEDHRTQIMYISLPVRDALGKVLGVAAIRLSPEHVASPLFAKDLLSQHRSGFLVNQQGIILANSANPSMNYQSMGSLDQVQAANVRKQFGLSQVPSLHLDDLNDRVAGGTNADSGFTTSHLLGAHETDVIGYSPVARQRWSVLVAEDQAVFTAEVNDLTRNQLLNTLILAVIIGSLVILAGRMFETTERESLSDPLTGLANRRFFQEILLRELRRAQRSNQPLALIIADIDHFKGVNDTYGHSVGDEVLEQVGSIMLASVRATDFVIRYGGEEFVVLMPETRSADAVAVADKLRKTIGDTILESTSRPGMTLKVTISGGVAAFPVDGQTGEQLILRADRALYWAKEHGRNRVSTMADVDGDKGEGGKGENVKPLASAKR